MVGVALAYSVTYAVGLALSTAVLRRRVGGLDGPAVRRTYARLLAAAVPAAVLAAAVSWGLGRALGDGVTGSAVSLAAGGTLFLVLYVVGARAMRVQELDTLLGSVRVRVRR
jgi:putative peptidoglycan lipid II flippase